MTTKTIKDVLKDAKDIDITRPDKYHSDYFSWYRWRMKCVYRAFMLLGARIAARGHRVIICKEYVLADMDGRKGYIQYNELTHTYYNRHTDCETLPYTDDMVIKASWSEIESLLNQSNTIEPFQKTLDRISSLTAPNDYIYIEPAIINYD